MSLEEQIWILISSAVAIAMFNVSVLMYSINWFHDPQRGQPTWPTDANCYRQNLVGSSYYTKHFFEHSFLFNFKTSIHNTVLVLYILFFKRNTNLLKLNSWDKNTKHFHPIVFFNSYLKLSTEKYLNRT